MDFLFFVRKWTWRKQKTSKNGGFEFDLSTIFPNSLWLLFFSFFYLIAEMFCVKRICRTRHIFAAVSLRRAARGIQAQLQRYGTAVKGLENPVTGKLSFMSESDIIISGAKIFDQYSDADTFYRMILLLLSMRFTKCSSRNKIPECGT